MLHTSCTTVLLCVAIAFLIPIPGSGQANHSVFPVAGEVLYCGDRIYVSSDITSVDYFNKGKWTSIAIIREAEMMGGRYLLINDEMITQYGRLRFSHRDGSSQLSPGNVSVKLRRPVVSIGDMAAGCTEDANQYAHCSISPNPASTTLNVEADRPIRSVQIVQSTSGSIVHFARMAGEVYAHTIDVSKLSAGSYFVVSDFGNSLVTSTQVVILR